MTEPWLLKLQENVKQTTEADMNCFLCKELTRERGIVVIPTVPKPTPAIIGICTMCKFLDGFEEEIARIFEECLNAAGEAEPEKEW